MSKHLGTVAESGERRENEAHEGFGDLSIYKVGGSEETFEVHSNMSFIRTTRAQLAKLLAILYALLVIGCADCPPPAPDAHLVRCADSCEESQIACDAFQHCTCAVPHEGFTSIYACERY